MTSPVKLDDGGLDELKAIALRAQRTHAGCEDTGCYQLALADGVLKLIAEVKRVRRAAGLTLPELAFHYDEQGRYHDADVASQGCGTCEAYAALRAALEESVPNA